jgi:PleD family two-component response regulator
MSNRARILVVEDDHDTADMLTAYFEAQNYEVAAAAWGQDALRIAQQDARPDLILLDIRLPDMDGYEICKQLRAQRRTIDVPIIFLTERRERSDRLSGLELGAVDYITKPFDIRELRLRVRNALQRSKFQTLLNPVTGLPDEDLVIERMDALLNRQNWALLMVNVAGLDAFADRYGFVARDDVLRALALVLSNSTAEGQTDPDASFVGQLNETSFVIVIDPARSHDLRDRIAARILQSANFFYPAKERGTGDGERPTLKFALGLVTDQNGPYSNGQALRAAAVNSMRVL